MKPWTCEWTRELKIICLRNLIMVGTHLAICVVYSFLLCDILWHTVQDSLQQVPIPLSLLQHIVSLMYCGPKSVHFVIFLMNGESSQPLFISAIDPLYLHTWAPVNSELLPKWTQNWSALYHTISEKIAYHVWLKLYWNKVKHIFTSYSEFCLRFELIGL